MPAPAMVRPRERLAALVAVAIVQTVLALVLLSGFRVEITRAPEAIERLIDVQLTPPPLPSPPKAEPKRAAAHPQSSAPKAEPKPLGGSPGPKPPHAAPSVTPVVALRPTVAPAGGGSGNGPGPQPASAAATHAIAVDGSAHEKVERGMTNRISVRSSAQPARGPRITDWSDGCAPAREDCH